MHLHSVHLSDGTTLDQGQYDALMRDGSVTLANGRIIERTPDFQREREMMDRIFSSFKPVGAP